VTDFSRNSANYCYRHPNRQSFVLCQRCGRTICPECQTPAAVGVHCPECVREQRAQFRQAQRTNGPSRFTVAGRRFAMLEQKATIVIMAISIVLYLLQLVPVVGNTITNAFAFSPAYLGSQPWRLVTSLFVHGGFLQLAFNMWALFLFGRMLEQMVGSWRFVTLYLISGIAGGMAVSLIAPGGAILGSSPAIFALFACYFMLARSLGSNAVQLLVVMALNLVIILVFGGAWEAFLGGIAAGFATGAIFTRTRNVRQKNLQIGLLIAEAVVAVALAYVGYAIHF
jgi:membrane associated rhomboid family serine protease